MNNINQTIGAGKWCESQRTDQTSQFHPPFEFITIA